MLNSFAMYIFSHGARSRNWETYFREPFACMIPSQQRTDNFSRTVRGVDWPALNAFLNNTRIFAPFGPLVFSRHSWKRNAPNHTGNKNRPVFAGEKKPEGSDGTF